MHIKVLPTCVCFCADSGRSVGALFAATTDEIVELTDLAHDLLPHIARWMEARDAANNKPK